MLKATKKFNICHLILSTISITKLFFYVLFQFLTIITVGIANDEDSKHFLLFESFEIIVSITVNKLMIFFLRTY